MDVRACGRPRSRLSASHRAFIHRHETQEVGKKLRVARERENDSEAIGRLVEELMAAGCMPKVAARVVTEAFNMGWRAAPTKDETADKRREWDRERKRQKLRERKSAESGGTQVEKTPEQRIWSDGVGLLVQLGLEQKAARENIGKWLKFGHDAARIYSLVAEAHTKGTGSPVAYVTAALGGTNGKSHHRGRSLADAADAAIARAEERERTFDLGPADYHDAGHEAGQGSGGQFSKPKAR